jgi:hypothetical protein
MMPAHQQLDGASGTDSRGFLFTDYGVPGQVKSLLVGQGPGPLDILPFHRYLAKIVRVGRQPQQPPILRRHVKGFGNFIGYRRNANGMRVRILFEPISG